IQGLYLAKVVVAGSTTPVWQEQVAIIPGMGITRNASIPGINSSATATIVLNATNGTASNNTFANGSTSLGTVNAGSAGTNLTATNRCGRIQVRNAANVPVDS